LRNRRIDSQHGSDTDAKHCKGWDEQTSRRVPPRPHTPTPQTAEQPSDTRHASREAGDDDGGDYCSRHAEGLQRDDQWGAAWCLKVRVSVIQHGQRHPK
jgi:hypothetical protein